MVCLISACDTRIKLSASVLALSYHPSTPNVDTQTHAYSVFTLVIKGTDCSTTQESCGHPPQSTLPSALTGRHF